METTQRDATAIVNADGLKEREEPLSAYGGTASIQERMSPPRLPSLAEAEAAFRRSAPDFETTATLDTLRASDFARLDRAGHVYLDYTGGGLYGESQVQEHMRLLLSTVFGNPHSINPTSLTSTHFVEQARAAVLDYFCAPADDYAVIFTANASGALKLVGESYPFGPGSTFLLTFDNHNSVNGIREFARARGAKVQYAPMLLPDLRVEAGKLTAYLVNGLPDAHKLFAYPAQSNFSGVQHSFEWIEMAHRHGWDVLLDAAAFAPTNHLDLGRWRPDFVSLSFYKMFGYPTGIGCLIARKAPLAKLRRPWFAGGTITVASVQGDRFYFQESAEAFEDGTLNYLGLPAIEIGLRYLQRIGVETIHTRVTRLTGWLLGELLALRHANGASVVHIYGPVGTEARGGTIALNFYDENGHFIDHRLVERQASDAGISLRTGCFCNPGASELALDYTADELNSCFVGHDARLSLDEFRRCIDDKSTGAVRVSVGLATTFADVYHFVEFARTFSR